MDVVGVRYWCVQPSNADYFAISQMRTRSAKYNANIFIIRADLAGRGNRSYSRRGAFLCPAWCLSRPACPSRLCACLRPRRSPATGRKVCRVRPRPRSQPRRTISPRRSANGPRRSPANGPRFVRVSVFGIHAHEYKFVGGQVQKAVYLFFGKVHV